MAYSSSGGSLGRWTMETPMLEPSLAGLITSCRVGWLAAKASSRFNVAG